MKVKETKENELMDALTYTGCTKLPKAVDISKPQAKIWIRAIAKVTKVDGSWSYAIIKNDYGRKPKFAKVFGSVAAISAIKTVYPYQWLDSSLVPKFRNEDERVAFIAEAYGQADASKIGKLAVEERDRLFYTWCIAQQAANHE